MGFSGERDLANPELTNSKRSQLSDELRKAITKEVQYKILPKLTERFENVLGKEGWNLKPSAGANEEMTLLFHYPAAFEYKDSLRPQIKIEFGRGDQQPSAKYLIRPFVAEEFPDTMKDSAAEITVLEAQARVRGFRRLRQ